MVAKRMSRQLVMAANQHTSAQQGKTSAAADTQGCLDHCLLRGVAHAACPPGSVVLAALHPETSGGRGCERCSGLIFGAREEAVLAQPELSPHCFEIPQEPEESSGPAGQNMARGSIQ